MIETEIWGIIPENEFEKVKDTTSSQLGQPKISRRLSIEISDWNNKFLDTRIRITDGSAEVMQKVGAWNNRAKEEVRMELKNDPTIILQQIKILRNHVLQGDPRLLLYQFENYIYDTQEYELKLSHQFGAGDKYCFEVEQKNSTVDIVQVAKSYGLEEYPQERDIAFWDKWNAESSLDGLKMSDEQILEMIKKYINA